MHKNIKRGILFIGMGDLDLEQLYLAKSYSFYTIVTNKNPNSKALKYADLKDHREWKRYTWNLTKNLQFRHQNCSYLHWYRIIHIRIYHC